MLWPLPPRRAASPCAPTAFCTPLWEYFTFTCSLTHWLLKLVGRSFEGKDWLLFLHFQHLVECLTHSNCLVKIGGGKEGRREGGRKEESYMMINEAAVYSTIEKVVSGDKEGWPEREQWLEWGMELSYMKAWGLWTRQPGAPKQLGNNNCQPLSLRHIPCERRCGHSTIPTMPQGPCDSFKQGRSP